VVPLPRLLGDLPLPRGTLAHLGKTSHATPAAAGGTASSSSSSSLLPRQVVEALRRALAEAFAPSGLNRLPRVRRSQPLEAARLNKPMQQVVVPHSPRLSFLLARALSLSL